MFGIGKLERSLSKGIIEHGFLAKKIKQEKERLQRIETELRDRLQQKKENKRSALIKFLAKNQTTKNREICRNSTAYHDHKIQHLDSDSSEELPKKKF